MSAFGLNYGLRRFTSRRRAFGFEKLFNYDDTVTVQSPKGPVEIPLEAHPIGTHGPSTIPFDESLLEILACPISRQPLKFDRERNVLVSEATGYAFPINKTGMPIFLKKWAIPIDKL